MTIKAERIYQVLEFIFLIDTSSISNFWLELIAVTANSVWASPRIFQILDICFWNIRSLGQSPKKILDATLSLIPISALLLRPLDCVHTSFLKQGEFSTLGGEGGDGAPKKIGGYSHSHKCTAASPRLRKRIRGCNPPQKWPSCVHVYLTSQSNIFLTGWQVKAISF